jgi:hypothetical protein
MQNLSNQNNQNNQNNQILIHRKIYDNQIVDLVNSNILENNSVDLFITHEQDYFIIQNYKNNISPILGYRFNFPDGGFNYIPLANYYNTTQFLQPYCIHSYNYNLDLINMTDVFNAFDIHMYKPKPEQNFYKK